MTSFIKPNFYLSLLLEFIQADIPGRRLGKTFSLYLEQSEHHPTLVEHRGTYLENHYCFPSIHHQFPW